MRRLKKKYSSAVLPATKLLGRVCRVVSEAVISLFLKCLHRHISSIYEPVWHEPVRPALFSKNGSMII